MKKIFSGDHEILLGGRKEEAFWKEFNSREQAPQLVCIRGDVTEKDIRQMESTLEFNINPVSYFIFGESVTALEKTFFSHYKIINAAGGVVRNEKGKTLMIFRRGRWDLPKGKLDKGESLRDAARRETTEETGVGKLKIIRPVKFLDDKQECTYHTYQLRNSRVLKASYWYEMSSNDTRPLVPQANEGITGVGWFGKNQIRENLKNSYHLVEWVLKETSGT